MSLRRLVDLPSVRRIQTGPFGTQLKAAEYEQSGLPLISAGEIRAGSIELDKRTPRVSPATIKRLPQFVLDERDVVFARKGAIERAAWVNPEYGQMFLGSDGVVVSFDSADEARFYAFYFRLPSVAAWLHGHAAGSTMLSLSSKVLGQLPVCEFGPEDLKGTVEVLGALDDKIAANRRVIDAGDVFIRALYSSTPKASTGRTFADVAAVGGGGTPSTKNPLYWDGVVGWATPTDVTGADGPWLAHTTRRISEDGLNNCASPLYPEGSILMTSRATIGAVVVARKPMAVNQGFIVLNAVESEMQWWLESQVRARTAEFETWANGATFLEISRGTFKKLPVLECLPEDLGRFNRTAEAVRERQSSCQVENDRLTRTRDELLPLLMDGRITVKDAEGAVGDVV